MVIDFGDGTWQKRLDANQCPKCRHELKPHTVVFGVREGTQLLRCSLCKLEIIQRAPKEVAMLETKLMPSEEDLCAAESQGADQHGGIDPELYDCDRRATNSGR